MFYFIMFVVLVVYFTIFFEYRTYWILKHSLVIEKTLFKHKEKLSDSYADLLETSFAVLRKRYPDKNTGDLLLLIGDYMEEDTYTSKKLEGLRNVDEILNDLEELYSKKLTSNLFLFLYKINIFQWNYWKLIKSSKVVEVFVERESQSYNNDPFIQIPFTNWIYNRFIDIFYRGEK